MRPIRPLTVSLLALGLAGCASLAPPAGSPPAQAPAARVASMAASAPGTSATAPARAASAPQAAASAPTPGQPPAFATVVRDATSSSGLLAVWQKEDKVWLELKPEDFNRPLYFSPKLARGLGESSIYGGLMRVSGSRIDDQVVEFRRVHNQVQLVALNTLLAAAAPGSPEARAAETAFTYSLLSSTPVASAPHPERKSVLVDAAPCS